MTGTYGTRQAANINTSEDCDIYYCYRPSRSSDSPEYTNFKRLDNGNLKASKAEDGRVVGMYDLKLPVKDFGKEGFYTIYIKPKEYETTIQDVSTLAAYPNIRGIILKGGDIPSPANNGLVGYRVEYTESDDDDRIITSSNACEPIAQNMSDSSQKGIRYRFNSTGNLYFCTVTPSTALSFNSSTQPYIGTTSETIRLVSTKFNPVAIEIEMTRYDVENLTTMLEGSQIRNLDAGIITTFDDNGDIYHQAMYGNITNPTEGIHHDVKIKNDGVIDFNEKQNYEKIRDNF